MEEGKEEGKEISPIESCGAGVLPFIYHKLEGNEELYFLFQIPQQGKKQNYYVDFGGWKDETDVDVIANAAREFSEETLGLLSPFIQQNDNENYLALEQNAELEEIQRIKRGQQIVEEKLRNSLYSSQFQPLVHPVSGYTFFFLQMNYFDKDCLKEKFNHEKKRNFTWVSAVNLIDENCKLNLFPRIKVDNFQSTIKSIYQRYHFHNVSPRL